MTTQPLWQPSKTQIANANMTHFMQEMAKRWHKTFTNYQDLWQWSVDEPADFWASIWDYMGVIGERGQTVVKDLDKMPGAKWFPEARLNFAENLLRRRDAHDALVFWGEDKVKQRFSYAQVYQQVAQLAAALSGMGIKSGDRVAAYIPNMAEAVIAMLATSAIGATYTAASPDFGVQGVIDRFGQVEPKILITVDGYYYNNKVIDILDKVSEVKSKIPSLQKVVIIPYIHHDDTPNIKKISDAILWEDFLTPYSAQTEINFVRVPFNHPLYILYSSGTTGVPKCIVHSVGGVLLQHLKEHRLQTDLKPNDKLCYFTTCGWMMWNWLASGIGSDVTLLLYDGSPLINEGNILFDLVDQEQCTHLGVSAKFIDAINKNHLHPRKTHKLSSLRMMLSTGSPLSHEGFEYVYREIKTDVQLCSISGGTDIVSCFVLGCPILPVWNGEIQCRGLGLYVEVLDDNGKPIRGDKGEFSCLKSFPCMPIGFWNDPIGTKYHAAYFENIPNVWCHGDFAEITEHNGIIIYGRSDATLKPGGVRIGTAEIYRQVEKLPEVIESIAIGQKWDQDERVILFVHLKQDARLTEELIQKIKKQIRDNASPRHVPAKVIAVMDIPRTKSGKITEIAVRDVVHGKAVKNAEALANPEALELYKNLPELAA